MISNFLQKRDLLRNGKSEHEKFKTALIIEGGVMRGAWGGGAVIGLEELGMVDAFDYVIGVSSGAAACAYFLAGQSKLGTSIYYEDMADRRFINYFRLKKISILIIPGRVADKFRSEASHKLK